MRIVHVQSLQLSGYLTLKICQPSWKHRLLFNTFNSFNVNIESFHTIYRNDIQWTNISWKTSSFWEVWNCGTSFLIKGCFNKVKKKLLILNINLTGHKKVHFEYDSWSSWRHESLFCFSSGGRRFFLRVAVTVISIS